MAAKTVDEQMSIPGSEKIPARIPRKVRRQMLRAVDRQGKRLVKGIEKAAGIYHKVIQGKDIEALHKRPEFPHRKVQFFNEGMLKDEGVLWTNPLTGAKERARLDRMIVLEKNSLMEPATDTTEAKESVKYDQRTLRRVDVKSYMREALKEVKEIAKANGQSELVESISGWDDMGMQDWNALSTSSKPGQTLPYPPGPYTRQLYIPDQWLMLSNAARAYNYNPLAKAGIDTKTAFVVGTGPRIVIKNEALSKVWKDFERREDLLETSTTWTSMLSQNGELFVEFFLNKMNEPTMRSIDPGTVYEIITEPRDIRQVYGYRLMYQTQYQIFGEGAKGEQVPLSEWIYETIKPDNVIHIKVNVQENEKRGRSDLLSVLWVCDLLEEYMRYKVVRAMVECAFAWDVTLENGDQTDIDDFLNDENATFPKPNSTYVHNQSVKREATGFSGAAASVGRDGVFDMLVTIFAAGIRTSKDYMGVSEGGTRATAITSTEPNAKEIELRRHKLETVLIRLVDFVASSKGIQYSHDEVEVSWPEIAPENASEKIRNLFMMMDRTMMSEQRVAEMATKELGVTNYDFLKELDDIANEMSGGKHPILSASMRSGFVTGQVPTAPVPGAPPPVPHTAKTEPGKEEAPKKDVSSVSNDTRREVTVKGLNK